MKPFSKNEIDGIDDDDDDEKEKEKEKERKMMEKKSGLRRNS